MATSLHQEKMFDCSGSSQHLRISLLWKSFLKLWWGMPNSNIFSSNCRRWDRLVFPAQEHKSRESREGLDYTHVRVRLLIKHISNGARNKNTTWKVLQGCLTLLNLFHGVRFVYCWVSGVISQHVSPTGNLAFDKQNRTHWKQRSGSQRGHKPQQDKQSWGTFCWRKSSNWGKTGNGGGNHIVRLCQTKARHLYLAELMEHTWRPAY